jgi:hypothetical protein
MTVVILVCADDGRKAEHRVYNQQEWWSTARILDWLAELGEEDDYVTHWHLYDDEWR